MYRLHIFSHHYPDFSLKPSSDGIVYRGTVTQVDDIRKEVEVKELGSTFKSYRHFCSSTTLWFPTEFDNRTVRERS